jgi:hypothetical protein
MILKFTNKQIFFVVESIWQDLDYRFKYQLNTLVTANDENDYIQDVEVSVSILMQCYKAMSSGAYGCTVNMAEVLLESLKTQLLESANIVAYEEYLASLDTPNPLPEVIPNEQTLALLDIKKYKEQDEALEAAKILNGKTQILQP